MANKRSSAQTHNDAQEMRRADTKRLRLPPPSDNSSESSTCSVSEATALHSSPHTSLGTKDSSMSSHDSVASNNSDESITSSSSESEGDEDSDSSEMEDDSDNEVVTVRGTKRPAIGSSNVLTQARSLQSRLAAFIPKLQQANCELDDEGGDPNMENVDEEDQHIEMNLGLGVLEEQRDDDDSEEDEEEEEEDFVDGNEVNGQSSSQRTDQKSSRERDAMQRLLGLHKPREKAGIEVVDDL